MIQPAPTVAGPARILPTKYAPPCSDGQHLQRRHLLERMDQASNARLILVHAGAGFGKTTLLQQYHAHRLSLGRPALWINLDAADNDLQRLVTLVAHGLRGLAASDTVPRNLQDVLELIRRQPPFALLLDEFEVIHAPAALAFVQQILDALPQGSVLIIATRAVPELDLERLRSRHQLLELAPSELRFSLEETTRFVRDVRQVPLLNNLVASLYRRTEGWITAIYLACLSLQGREEHAAMITAFSGSNLQLAEYLTEDILGRLDDDCRRFLLHTSVLDQFNAELCDTLTDRDDSTAMLARLERDHLFLIPIEGKQQWFRFHSLFSSYLRDTLERQSPGLQQTLRQRAAHWFLAAGRPIPAIEYLLEAGLPADAAGQLAEHFDGLVETGRTRMLLRWLDRIPGDLLDAHPRLNLAYAWALVFARRFRDATQLIERLAQSGEELEAQTLRCLLLGVTDQVEECCELSFEQLRRLPAEETFQTSVLVNVLAYNLLSFGRHAEAKTLLAEHLQNESSLMRGVSDCNESILDLTQGRLRAALARLQDQYAEVRHNSSGRPVGALLTRDSIHAVLLYERDDMEQAEALLARILPTLKDASTPDTLITSHVLMARLALRRGERDTWLRHLMALERVGHMAASSRIQCSAWLERTRVATLEGRLEAAAQALAAAEAVSDWDRPGVLLHGNDVDTPLLARARLHIAEGEYGRAVEQLTAAIEDAQARTLGRREIKLHLLLGTALEGLGQAQPAVAALEHALVLAGQEGFLQTFFEEGERLAQLLRRWALLPRPSGVDSDFVERLLSHFGIAANAPAPLGGEGSEALSRRELQVLQLLAAGHRNRAIAEKMFLSECTVKSHLRKINSKLGAQGRAQAVAIARSRGWLD